jgi:hypothetical protein
MGCIRSSPALLALLAAALVAGCATEGEFPSLAPREAERVYAEEARSPPPKAPVLPDDPAIAERAAALVAAGRGGNEAYESAMAAARRLVSAAGAPGTESWIAAQQAVSRVEAARAETVNALADLDRLAIAEAGSPPLSDADFARLTSATAELQQLADRQHEALARLRESLRRP